MFSLQLYTECFALSICSTSLLVCLSLAVHVAIAKSIAVKCHFASSCAKHVHVFYIIKETLLALVRDLFTFSSKVIKRFIIV
jgi:hypothetical protein